MTDLTAKTFTLNTGATIPAIGLGTWKSRPGDVTKAVEYALRAGYRHIDGALAYGNEKEVGLGIRNSGVPRSEIFVTTKLDNPWHKRVEEGITTSLRDLGLDYVDLYLIHWPSSQNPEKPNEVYSDWDYVDTWAEMQKLPESGRVRAIGVSNFGITHLERLLNAPSTKIVPAVNQIELHPTRPSPKLVAYCKSKGIHCSGYSPLGGSPESPVHQSEAVLEVSRKYGKSVPQILLAWGVQSGWSVLPKSVSEERIRGNFLGLKGWRLEEEDVRRLREEVKERFKNCGDEWLSHRVFFGDDE